MIGDDLIRPRLLKILSNYYFSRDEYAEWATSIVGALDRFVREYMGLTGLHVECATSTEDFRVDYLVVVDLFGDRRVIPDPDQDLGHRKITAFFKRLNRRQPKYDVRVSTLRSVR